MECIDMEMIEHSKIKNNNTHNRYHNKIYLREVVQIVELSMVKIRPKFLLLFLYKLQNNV